MKYIDADLLRKEIKRLEKAAHKSALSCADSETRKFHEGKDFAYQHVGILIDPFQQEQDLIVINKKDWEAQEQFRKNKDFWKPLQQEQEENKPNLLKSLKEYFEKTSKEQLDADWEKLKVWNEIGPDVETYCKTQREHQEVDLEKFTKKMDAWKARYNNYPDNIIVKGTMAFTARMFYMYPNIAREWYDGLPKVTLD